MALSWPEEAVMESANRNAQRMVEVEATRARVEETQRLASETAFNQGLLQAADEVILAAGTAAAQAQSIVGVLQATNALIATNSARVSQQIMMQSGHTQMTGDGVIREQC
jgi:hypothetical protein